MIDRDALRLSLELAALTTLALLVLGLPLAAWVARSRRRWKFLVEAVVSLPLVLPPTVLGYYLLVLIGTRGPLGAFLLHAFGAHETNAKHLMVQQLALPAYEQVLKAAHTFNLLDARGAISVTERAAYIGRVRALARQVAQAYYDSREALGFPMAKQMEKSA